MWTILLITSFGIVYSTYTRQSLIYEFIGFFSINCVHLASKQNINTEF